MTKPEPTYTHQQLKQKAAACRYCHKLVAHELKPVFMMPEKAKVVIISQAPGRLAHESGIAWNDASGDRLRDWLGVTRDVFYREGNFAVVPMSFCFPGYKNNADAPPLRPCAPKWHPAFLRQLTPRCTIYIGRYAQQYYLPQYSNLTQAVENWQSMMPGHVALPHPSGRNNRWLTKHGWFHKDLVPALRKLISQLVST